MDQAQSKEQLVKIAREIQQHYITAKADMEVQRQAKNAKVGDILTLPNGKKIQIIALDPKGDHEFKWVQ